MGQSFKNSCIASSIKSIICTSNFIKLIQGAAIPEAWLTAFQLLSLAKLNQGQSVVIYAGASGVGTAATQIAKKVMNLKPYCVASSR